MGTIDEQLALIRVQLGMIAERLSGEGRQRAFTIKEAAEQLRMGTTTLKQMIRDGDLLTVKKGRRRLVSAVELDRWIATHTERPTPRQARTRGKTEEEKIRAKMRR